MSQPLKRFLQCHSLTMMIAVFIVLFGVSSTALTTFGKSNSQNQPTPPPIRAKDCNTQADCTAMRDTSCVRDYVDDRLKCLCGDNAPPINGFCSAKYKGLRHICTENKNCDEGMLCNTENSTRTSMGYRNAPSNNYKLCLCDEEAGYVESLRANICSGALQIITGTLVPLLSLIVGSLVARRPTVVHHC